MQRYTRLKYALIIQGVLLLLTIFVFRTVAPHEVTRLSLVRAKILVSDVEATITQAHEMQRLARGPKRGDTEYFKPIHAELLAKTSSVSSLDSRIAQIDYFIDTFTFGIAPSSDKIGWLKESSTQLYISYVALKENLRYIDAAMDATSNEFSNTQYRLTKLENALSDTVIKINNIEQ
jgi:hypothetical protein